MKLGLITDIHEQVELLQTALDRFEQEKVDQIVFIGDVVLLGNRLAETCRLLSEADVIGVWGNHDFGICTNPSEEMRETYGESVIHFFTTLKPKLVIEDCLVTHVEPWLDPNKIEDLWYFDGPPDSPKRLQQIFCSAQNACFFVGHYHRWMHVTPDGISDWAGDRPMILDRRNLIVVGAICEGRFAIFDTATKELVPFNEMT